MEESLTGKSKELYLAAKRMGFLKGYKKGYMEQMKKLRNERIAEIKVQTKTDSTGLQENSLTEQEKANETTYGSENQNSSLKENRKEHPKNLVEPLPKGGR